VISIHDNAGGSIGTTLRYMVKVQPGPFLMKVIPERFQYRFLFYD